MGVDKYNNLFTLKIHKYALKIPIIQKKKKL